MAKVPLILFAQDVASRAVIDDLVFIGGTKTELEGKSTEVEAELSCYLDGDFEIYIERLNSEKVRRAFGSDEQQRLLQEFS